MLTSRKTSHGPQKSMMTAPSEITKATGIWPWAGGLSEFALLACLLSPELPVVSIGAAFAESRPITKRASAAIKPDFAAALTRSFRFMELVRAFMAAIISQPRLAAMPIITTFLPGGYFSLSFDFRMSHLTQCPKVVDASDARCSFQSSCRNVDRLLRELPDGDDRAENQEQIDCHLGNVAALFFRANQKRVSGFELDRKSVV